VPIWLVFIVSRVALYQASVSGLLYVTDHLAICLSVCRPVCPQSVLWQNDWVDPDAVGMVSWSVAVY